MPNQKFDRLRKAFSRHRSSIQEIVREPTAGGIIFRRNSEGNVEFLLAQDQKERWTIPKGHIEPGETAQQTARREITEEVGLREMDFLGWLGKVNFRYRRLERLVLMTTQIYLVRATGNTDGTTRDHWMTDLRWMSVSEALDKIEYEDIGKLMLLALKKIRQENL